MVLVSDDKKKKLYYTVWIILRFGSASVCLISVRFSTHRWLLVMGLEKKKWENGPAIKKESKPGPSKLGPEKAYTRSDCAININEQSCEALIE